MCGRYYIESTSLIEKLLAMQEFKTGEIYPGDTVPILISSNKAVLRTFGKRINKRMLFNARSETLLEKPMFKNLSHGLVLASSYFEWDQAKQKHQFFFHKNQYMACVYDNDSFYILTTRSTHPYHHRQPLFLSGKDALDWLNQVNTTMLLMVEPIQLSIDKKIDR